MCPEQKSVDSKDWLDAMYHLRARLLQEKCRETTTMVAKICLKIIQYYSVILPVFCLYLIAPQNKYKINTNNWRVQFISIIILEFILFLGYSVFIMSFYNNVQ